MLPRPRRRLGRSRTGGTAPAGPRTCAHRGPGPGTGPCRGARAARPGCGPYAAPAPRHPAVAAPPGAAPSPRYAPSNSACPNRSCPSAAAAPVQRPAAPAAAAAPAPHPAPPAGPQAQHPSPRPRPAAAHQARAAPRPRRTDRGHRTQATIMLNLNYKFKHPEVTACRTGPQPPQTREWTPADRQGPLTERPAPLNRGQAPEFTPLLYTLDLLLPIAGFGQKGAFNPHGWQYWLAAGLIAAG